MRAAIKFIGIYIGLSLFIGLMWIVSSYPDTPSTAAQWFWIFALALPLQVAFEFVGELLWNNKATRLLEQKTADKSFSLLRIFFGVVLLCAFIGLLIGLTHAWSVLRPVIGL